MMRITLFLAALFFLAATTHAQNDETQLQRVSRAASERGGFNPALKPFYHGVASGDPTPSSVMIWTRITPENNPASVSGKYFVATDTLFKTPIKTGTFTTDAARDFNVKIDVTDLNPGTTYYYYFQALNANSLIGRAKTTPTGSVDNLKFAVVSCSNYEGGYFNAYGEIAKRNDIDAVLHLGDYIYEYGAGTYGIQLPGRINEPATEILTLADYRTRYSLYRLDPDLIRLHQQHTFINIWDDHESANDSYVDGAENHQANEGSWEARKAISKQVYFEWMPIRDYPNQQIYRKVAYGPLCDLIMLDTRLEGRVMPPPHFDTPDNPVRTMISQTQYNWLMDNLKKSTARWKIVGNQVLFSTMNVGFAGGAFDGTPDPTNLDSIRQAEDLFIDNWESYPTQRNGIIDSIRVNKINNVVVVTGDSHCSWAFDVTKAPVNYPAPPFNLPAPNPYNAATGQGYNSTTGDGSWAVEFGTPSISSPNFDESIGVALTGQFEFLINNPVPGFGLVYNPHLKYVDLDRNGYFVLDLRAEAAQADFYYVPTVSAITDTETFGTGVRTLDKQNRLQVSTTATAAKPVQDVPTPVNPPAFVSSFIEPHSGVAVFNCYPNPTSGEIYFQVGFNQKLQASVAVYDLNGRRLRTLLKAADFEPGVYNLASNLNGLAAGTYVIGLESKGKLVGSMQIVLK